MPGKCPKAPEEFDGDKAHHLAKVAFSAIPVLGGTAAELFQWLIEPPIEKRRR